MSIGVASVVLRPVITRIPAESSASHYVRHNPLQLSRTFQSLRVLEPVRSCRAPTPTALASSTEGSNLIREYFRLIRDLEDLFLGSADPGLA